MSKTTVSTPDAVKMSASGLPALQVRVVDRQPGRRVVVAPLGAARLRRAPEAVLGAEDGDQVHPVVGVHDVDDVADVPGDPGRVGDDADPLPSSRPYPSAASRSKPVRSPGPPAPRRPAAATAAPGPR